MKIFLICKYLFEFLKKALQVAKTGDDVFMMSAKT